MDRQNITLSLPKEILLKAKLLAVQRQTSVSGLLTQALENLVRQQGGLAHARLRHLQWLEQGADLGTDGQIPARRDELHNRTWRLAVRRHQCLGLCPRSVGGARALPCPEPGRGRVTSLTLAGRVPPPG